MQKIPVGILGATGMVGQQYIRLLENHPWFEVAYLAASPASAGKKYRDALKSGWVVAGTMPARLGEMVVEDVGEVQKAAGKCALVFSAFEMSDKEEIRNRENEYAAAGMAVFSNASAHRGTPDVPMIIGEINAHHLDIIPTQQKNHGWEKGFVVVKPNCSLQSYLAPIYALMNAGYEIPTIMVTTMQAVSGAGYPGVASLDMIDNIVPFIGGEEEKTEQEPLKILGDMQNGAFVPFSNLKISAHCNRVPVTDGHTACVSFAFGEKKADVETIKKIWQEFKGEPQTLDLPMAPMQPIIYREELNRPQPRRDRDADKAMAVTVGRLRPDSVLDFKFVALSHNTVRGAAGGGVLSAELAYKKGFLKV